MLRKVLIAAGVVAVFCIFSYGSVPAADSNAEENDAIVATTTDVAPVDTVATPVISDSSHIPTPEVVKALYMTSWIASSERRDKIVKMIEETEINALVIDVKDDTGRVSYDSQDPAVTEAGSVEVRIRDLDEFIEELHSKGIYVIARVAVFQDPYLATRWTDEAVQNSDTGGVWKDRKGLSWIDASSTRYHKYISALAKDAYSHGFDEINFDYVRFPTDGAVSSMSFPRSGERDRADVMEDFFTYINDEMDAAGIPSSADVFGLVTSAEDDMGIGQVLEVALEHFDFVCPMVYPSHFADGSYGYGDPNAVPGPIIAKSMGDAARRAEAMALELVTATSTQMVGTTTTTVKAIYKVNAEKAAALKDKLRPWLQDFDYGDDYSAADVRAQIDASEELGLDSWFLWDPSVVYTREALKNE
jgi:hypothetical protein